MTCWAFGATRRVTGKSAASDLEKRKKSLPVVFGLERLPAFADAYAAPQAPDEPVQGLADMLEEVGARHDVEERVAVTTEAAMSSLKLAEGEG